MLKEPALSEQTIITCLHDNFGLDISQVAFLPLGDARNAIYHVSANCGTADCGAADCGATVGGAGYFLKLCPADFDEGVVAVPAFIHAQSIQQIIAPLPTKSQTLWLSAHDFTWILYPFFQGQNGFEMALSKEQWYRLGAGLRRIHQTDLPAELVKHIPQEEYSPRWRDMVKALDKEVAHKEYDDPIAASFAALWMSKRDEIQILIQRAEELAQVLENRPLPKVICHTDLHAGNVMVAADDKIAIVDWDEPILAPKERDLMFIGGGIGGTWNDEQEVAWFYEGYGEAEIDMLALAYYRYERIVVDIAVYAQQIFEMRGSVKDRQDGLRLIEQFGPNNVVEIAHRTYHCLGANVS